LKYMGQGFNREQLQRIVDEVDADKSGEIEWPEFLEIMKRFYSGKLAPGSGSSSAKTTAASPAKTTPTTTTTTASKAPTPAPASPSTTPKSTGFTPAKPATTPAKSPSSSGSSSSLSSSGSVQVGGQRGSSTKCSACGKTVYPIEAVAAMDQVWHKGCFKCQGEGCGLTLNLKTFTGVEGKVYCKQHTPKLKPTQTTLQGSLVTSSQANAPKINKVQGIQKNARTTFAPGQLQPFDPDAPQEE